MRFVAQVAMLDDEAAFRLADLKNRACQDVSDLERPRNYAAALRRHYGYHLTRMTERLKLSKGWLSKMIKVAGIPHGVIAALASPAEVQLKPGDALAPALDGKEAARAILTAARGIAKEQAARRVAGQPPYPAAAVLRRLMDSPNTDAGEGPAPFVWTTPHSRPGLSVQSVNRQGVTIRLHAGLSADTNDLANALHAALAQLEAEGRGLVR